MGRIRCFMLEPLARANAYLRRYAARGNKKCPGADYHNAMTAIGERDLKPEKLPAHAVLVDDSKPPRDDARWPRKCEACDYVFAEDDEWQLFYRPLMRRADTGEAITTEQAPPGAMWDAAWYPQKGPDGASLMVKLPPGGPGDEWSIDMPGTGNSRWTRTGTAPDVTASPSILTPRYHGWLRDGWLVEC